MTSRLNSAGAGVIRVRCLGNRIANLNERFRAMGFTEETAFDLSVGREYVVHSMCIWAGMLMYLCNGDGDGNPNWYPAIVFDTVAARLPTDWWMGVAADAAVTLICGYEAIVKDPSHFDALAERNAEALRVFLDAQRART